LKILLELTPWFNEKSQVKDLVAYVPTSLKLDTLRWLQASHAKFDREYRVLERHTALEHELNQKNVTNVSVFKRMEIGVGDVSLAADDVVKLSITNSGKGGGKKKVVVRILGFEAEDLPPDRSSYNGRVLILFRRYPKELYTAVERVSMSALDITSSFFADKHEMKALDDSIPGQLQAIFTEDADDIKAIMELNESAELKKSTNYIVGFQILDSKGRKVINRPQSKAAMHDRYKVKLNVDKYDLGETADLYRIEPLKKCEKVFTGSKDFETSLDTAYYSFFKVHFSDYGQFSLFGEVLMENESILQREIKVVVMPGQISSIVVEPIEEGDFGGIFPLGSFLPGFNLSFRYVCVFSYLL
jgi:hypothetical protein